MNKLISLLLERKFAAKLLTLFIITIGAWAASNLPLAKKSRFDMREGNIVTTYQGAIARVPAPPYRRD